MKNNIAIFASGNGSNAEEIINYFKDHKSVRVALILSNNPKAFVLQRAENHQIPHYVFSREHFYKSKMVDEILKLNNIDFIVLAGFMWLMPGRIVKIYSDKIINIHPALLPKYGGKGMYGHHVHEAVVQNKEKESGITIHWVNEEYDKGSIIKQVKCAISPEDSAEELASKVHQLEYEHYPKVIEQAVLGK
ncbi:MAG: phosphoribosylglycinamide formyltransferase [Cyclobacteriaceae bacterium]|nr:phosphoribosylglycinamide formyltransferase [Cyclobacteriaceae bacterium]